MEANSDKIVNHGRLKEDINMDDVHVVFNVLEEHLVTNTFKKNSLVFYTSITIGDIQVGMWSLFFLNLLPKKMEMS